MTIQALATDYLWLWIPIAVVFAAGLVYGCVMLTLIWRELKYR
jgi:hypothetical protein